MSASAAVAKRQQHTALFEAMAGRLGLREAFERLTEADAKHEAVDRCMDCRHASACGHWLAETENAQSSPDYCENTDMFEHLKREIEAEGLSPHR